MDKDGARMKIMAAAYAAAAALGVNEAIRLLEQAAAALRDEQWRGPANR